MPDIVEITDTSNTAVTELVTDVVEVGYTQLIIPGDGFASGGSYEHVQTSSASTWTISHNLGFNPSVSLSDTDGYSIDGLVTWPTLNTVSVAFGASTAGAAHLS